MIPGSVSRTVARATPWIGRWSNVFTPAFAGGKGLRQWRQAVPFWLCSLILHLTSFLLIASLTCPWAGQRGQSGSKGISLIISFGEAEQSRGQEPLVISAAIPAPEPLPPGEATVRRSPEETPQAPAKPRPARSSAKAQPEKHAARDAAKAKLGTTCKGQPSVESAAFAVCGDLNRNRVRAAHRSVVAQPLRPHFGFAGWR